MRDYSSSCELSKISDNSWECVDANSLCNNWVSFYPTTVPTQSTPSPISVVLDYRYKACYNDEGSRAMTEVSFDGTFDDCTRACSSYYYFALQNGGAQCFCGNLFPDITRYGLYDGSMWGQYSRSDCSLQGSEWFGG